MTFFSASFRGNNNSERRFRFPNPLRIRLGCIFRRSHAKPDYPNSCSDATAFFEGFTKYDDIETVIFDLEHSFFSSDSYATPASESSSGSEGSNFIEKRHTPCCVDDYIADDGSLDEFSACLVSSQQSSIIDNNNITGNIYTIINELMAEQEKSLKCNRFVDPSKLKGEQADTGENVAFSMNSSVFSGRYSGILSTASAFCIFNDDASLLSGIDKQFQQQVTAELSSNCHHTYEVQISKDHRVSSLLIAGIDSPSPDLWTINWTEMIDDTDCSHFKESMLTWPRPYHDLSPVDAPHLEADDADSEAAKASPHSFVVQQISL